MRRPRLSLDVSGTVTAAICAVHCLAAPLLIAVGTLPLVGPLSAILRSPITEWGFVFSSAIIGATSLVPSFTRLHRDVIPGALFATGFVFLVGVRMAEPTPKLERITVPVAAALMIGAHVRNRQQCARCRRCLENATAPAE
jgi:hypothetical protein